LDGSTRSRATPHSAPLVIPTRSRSTPHRQRSRDMANRFTTSSKALAEWWKPVGTLAPATLLDDIEPSRAVLERYPRPRGVCMVRQKHLLDGGEGARRQTRAVRSAYSVPHRGRALDGGDTEVQRVEPVRAWC